MVKFLAKILPRPWLSLILLNLWLLLNNSLASGQILLGILLAIGITHLVPQSLDAPIKFKRPWRLFAYTGLVLLDIIRANFIVARQVLGPNSALKSRFLNVPLDLTHPVAISLFAGTITLTPGTVSCELSADKKFLLVHALHAENPIDEINALKQRYEARLSLIFDSETHPAHPLPRNKA
ncbi:MAG: Na+/H+ antiporter subunit E [Halothiobacillus sp. 24-54-40]|jgi:multicomponent K+:H+ antiporter subunit E|nr:Na+/H+ antiporter subunit E [Halothiobacillaceae bacterium]OYV47401.1 MAG: Na+/H+ antiporter subunit E [Halothiobacillus sp. 20-53-49]OYY41152.1 MAG: Na+/H+ antiporter subunit E [Halothiobacillus sp. 35-54-62]OYY52986.1 MAG: Na+/H+ antiporter subunit E [Halothiobacillus sp. 28-55-5]OYZ87499.1 MAG: Na+/H+ antiporter subunit E [Halothiobacillus sp. 24-54-40]OZA81072.1 MAG: Na+/H+ antiporter subunit E [Halothiobacillus sp. 39-53-45]HQS01619.1 Na+/H+ antiporter subunit E [Halothiobacillus sp.]